MLDNKNTFKMEKVVLAGVTQLVGKSCHALKGWGFYHWSRLVSM